MLEINSVTDIKGQANKPKKQVKRTYPSSKEGENFVQEILIKPWRRLLSWVSSASICVLPQRGVYARSSIMGILNNKIKRDYLLSGTTLMSEVCAKTSVN